MAPEVFRTWRAAGYVVGVRVNPLDGDGMDDLAAVMRGAPDVVGLPKVAEPEHIVRLDAEITRLERAYGLPEGSTAIWPNIELARGLVQTVAIARASKRVSACLMASEDLAADLGAERGPDGIELAYSRQRFLVDCVAAGVVAVDCPFTWRDDAGVESDTRWARRLGYKAKCTVAPGHAAIINAVLTPNAEEVAERAQNRHHLRGGPGARRIARNGRRLDDRGAHLSQHAPPAGARRRTRRRGALKPCKS